MGMMTRRNVKGRAVKPTVPPKEVVEIKNDTIPKTEYTKTEINRMSTAELKELAVSAGIENAEDKTGGELKKLLIEKFEL